MIMAHTYDDEAGFDEVQPRCDLCGNLQWLEGDDWNGETGNHFSCERSQALDDDAWNPERIDRETHETLALINAEGPATGGGIPQWDCVAKPVIRDLIKKYDAMTVGTVSIMSLLDELEELVR